jgi:hypothetical protein
MLELEAKARQKAAGGDRGNQHTGGKLAVTPIVEEPPKGEAAEIAGEININRRKAAQRGG